MANETNTNAAAANTNADATIKTTVFNLIILDESGSMMDLTNQTIAGCNETINVAKHAATENADAIRSLLSIYAFQDGGPIKSRYIVKNVKASDAVHVTENDYRPYGNTPLLDAVGSTLSELKAVAATHEDATGIITIITDGYENSSTHYSWQQVASLISQFKEMGWTVNLIGANIDVNVLSKNLKIDNAMAFSATQEGASEMWSEYNSRQSRKMCDYAADTRAFSSVAERKACRKSKQTDFFDDNE